jgi:hypothetical protein
MTASRAALAQLWPVLLLLPEAVVLPVPVVKISAFAQVATLLLLLLMPLLLEVLSAPMGGSAARDACSCAAGTTPQPADASCTVLAAVLMKFSTMTGTAAGKHRAAVDACWWPDSACAAVLLLVGRCCAAAAPAANVNSAARLAMLVSAEAAAVTWPGSARIAALSVAAQHACSSSSAAATMSSASKPGARTHASMRRAHATLLGSDPASAE